MSDSTSYWHTDVPVRYVDTMDKLEAAREAFSRAAFCGMDAEWIPQDKNPQAQLLQLALRHPDGSMEAFVLDLAILPPYAAAPVLRDLFRSPTTVKVGFNAAADLKAIARALGGAGAATVARTEPFVEVGAVNRFLRVRGAPGVSPVARRGLSGLVEAQLGLPLDKSLQCSQWDARPLSADQIRYAAADAVVLLELVSSYAAQAAPRKFCMRTYLQKQLEKSAERARRNAAIRSQQREAAAAGAEPSTTSTVAQTQDRNRDPSKGSDVGSSGAPAAATAAAPAARAGATEPSGARGGTAAKDEPSLDASASLAAGLGSLQLEGGAEGAAEEADEAEGAALPPGPAADADFDPEAEHVEAEPEAHVDPSEYEGKSDTEQLAIDVSRAWSYCLEMEGGRRVKVPRPEGEEAEAGPSRGGGGGGGRGRGGRGRGRCGMMGIGAYVHELTRQLNYEEGRSKASKQSELDALRGLHVAIPWEMDPRRYPYPRFLGDSGLEGLARQLRMCGLDASVAPKAPTAGPAAAAGGPGGRGGGGRKTQADSVSERLMAMRRMVEAAEAEGRVILTSDRGFVRRRYTAQICFVSASGKTEQLREVLNRFNIQLSPDQLLTRCAACNGEFIQEPFSRDDLPPGASVPEGVKERTDLAFWVCSNTKCYKVYWQGNMYSRAVQATAERAGMVGLPGQEAEAAEATD